MITTIKTSINVSLQFANSDELSDFYGMLCSAYSALRDKVESVDTKFVSSSHTEYLDNRSHQLLEFLSKFNPDTVFTC